MSVLRVILIEEDVTQSSQVAALLEGAGCQVVDRMPLCENLPERLVGAAVDLVAFSARTPDRQVCNCLTLLQSRSPCAAVVFSDDDTQQSIRRAIRAGASAYVSGSVRQERVRSVLDAAMARFEQFNALAEELVRTRHQLSERKLIERAKGIVMAQRSMTEEQAYKLMRKTAMDRNKRMAEIADSIISASELLGDQRASSTPQLQPVNVG